MSAPLPNSGGYPFMLNRLMLSLLVPADVDAVPEQGEFGNVPIGFRLPYWHADGKPHAHMFRVRLEQVHTGGQKYTQPSAEAIKKKGGTDIDATHPYLNRHYGCVRPDGRVISFAEAAKVAGKSLRIIEGELKAASFGKHLAPTLARESGRVVVTVGIGGCWLATRSEIGVHEMHPIIAPLLQPGDDIEVILDDDIHRNNSVNKAAGTLRRVLMLLGYTPKFVLLPEDKGGAKVGLDDWIKARGVDAARVEYTALLRTDGYGFQEHHGTLWKYLELRCGDKGPKANESNMLKVLLGHERYTKSRIWWDVVRRRLFHALHGEPKALLDADVTKETAWMQNHIGLDGWRTSLVMNGMLSLAATPTHHRNPVQEDIESVVWDGKDRLSHCIHEIYGTPDDLYNTEVGIAWFTGAVARAYKPGCQMDLMLVLEGPQGIAKSKSLEIIGGAFYVVLKGSMKTKDFILGAHGGWICDIDELGSFHQVEYNLIKSVITVRVDSVRAPYERITEERARGFVIAGTTNSVQYLRDESGNRRFLPVHCIGDVNLNWLRENRAQLLAEAKHRLDAGEEWWKLTIAVAEDEQLKRMEVDPWQPMILSILQKKGMKHLVSAGTRYFIATSELLHALGVEGKDADRPKQNRVAEVAAGLIRNQMVPPWERDEYDRPKRPLLLATGAETDRVRGFSIEVAAFEAWDAAREADAVAADAAEKAAVGGLVKGAPVALVAKF